MRFIPEEQVASPKYLLDTRFYFEKQCSYKLSSQKWYHLKIQSPLCTKEIHFKSLEKLHRLQPRGLAAKPPSASGRHVEVVDFSCSQKLRKRANFGKKTSYPQFFISLQPGQCQFRSTYEVSDLKKGSLRFRYFSDTKRGTHAGIRRMLKVCCSG